MENTCRSVKWIIFKYYALIKKEKRLSFGSEIENDVGTKFWWKFQTVKVLHVVSAIESASKNT